MGEGSPGAVRTAAQWAVPHRQCHPGRPARPRGWCGGGRRWGECGRRLIPPHPLVGPLPLAVRVGPPRGPSAGPALPAVGRPRPPGGPAATEPGPGGRPRPPRTRVAGRRPRVAPPAPRRPPSPRPAPRRGPRPAVGRGPPPAAPPGPGPPGRRGVGRGPRPAGPGPPTRPPGFVAAASGGTASGSAPTCPSAVRIRAPVGGRVCRPSRTRRPARRRGTGPPSGCRGRRRGTRSGRGSRAASGARGFTPGSPTRPDSRRENRESGGAGAGGSAGRRVFPGAHGHPPPLTAGLGPPRANGGANNVDSEGSVRFPPFTPGPGSHPRAGVWYDRPRRSPPPTRDPP